MPRGRIRKRLSAFICIAGILGGICVSAPWLITHIDRLGDIYRRVQRVQGTYSRAAVRAPIASRAIKTLTRQDASWTWNFAVPENFHVKRSGMLKSDFRRWICRIFEIRRNTPLAAKNATIKVRAWFSVIHANLASTPMLLLLIRIIPSLSSNFFTSRLHVCTCVIIEKIRKEGSWFPRKHSCYRIGSWAMLISCAVWWVHKELLARNCVLPFRPSSDVHLFK